MNPLDLVKLSQLMELTSGRPEVVIGLIDGPVAVDHPDLANSNVREIPGRMGGVCTMANSVACTHGTFVAGILSGKRTSSAPAICPGCTLLVRPIFSESTALNEDMPSATPEELAAAILDCVRAGVHVINLSAAFVQPSSSRATRFRGSPELCGQSWRPCGCGGRESRGRGKYGDYTPSLGHSCRCM